MSIKAVIFDMDGVLIDSEPIYLRQLLRFMESLGIADGKNEEAVYTGLNTKNTAQKIKELHPSVNASAERIQELLSGINSVCLETFSDELFLLDGISDWMQAFLAAGLKIAVASCSCYKAVHFIINRFNLAPYLTAITTGGEVNNGKPDPEIYLLTASRLGVFPSECLAIEDSENGILAAKAAAMQCYGFSGTDHFNTDFSLADHVFSRYDQETMRKILSLM